jgi:hypothetical protein
MSCIVYRRSVLRGCCLNHRQSASLRGLSVPIFTACRPHSGGDPLIARHKAWRRCFVIELFISAAIRRRRGRRRASAQTIHGRHWKNQRQQRIAHAPGGKFAAFSLRIASEARERSIRWRRAPVACTARSRALRPSRLVSVLYL